MAMWLIAEWKHLDKLKARVEGSERRALASDHVNPVEGDVTLLSGRHDGAYSPSAD
jgi:hypothetical protein